MPIAAFRTDSAVLVDGIAGSLDTKTERDNLKACASFLAIQSERTCPVCGMPPAGTRAIYCSRVCRDKAHRAHCLARVVLLRRASVGRFATDRNCVDPLAGDGYLLPMRGQHGRTILRV
jgi:hypothetical protein